MKTPDLIKTIEIKDKTGRVIGTKEVVTYPGLLSKAHEEGLARIETKLLQRPSDENSRTAIVRAFVETAKGHFEAIGDASPENVNSFIIPHLIRMAETRAKARALRDAVNIGIVSFEELDGDGLLPNGSDLGSGARPASAMQVAPDGNANTRPVETPNGNGSKSLMSEAQRRYLFRLLASKGMHVEVAHEHLKDRFKVASLKYVTKAQATIEIDRLLKGEEAAHAPAQH